MKLNLACKEKKNDKINVKVKTKKVMHIWIFFHTTRLQRVVCLIVYWD